MILLNEKLKSLRKEKDKTQQEMADDLSISIQSINKWENGKCLPDAVNLLNIAVYFNVSLDYLMNHEPMNKKRKTKKRNLFSFFKFYWR